jgi:hypothetical protein
VLVWGEAQAEKGYGGGGGGAWGKGAVKIPGGLKSGDVQLQDGGAEEAGPCEVPLPTPPRAPPPPRALPYAELLSRSCAGGRPRRSRSCVISARHNTANTDNTALPSTAPPPTPLQHMGLESRRGTRRSGLCTSGGTWGTVSRGGGCDRVFLGRSDVVWRWRRCLLSVALGGRGRVYTATRGLVTSFAPCSYSAKQANQGKQDKEAAQKRRAVGGEETYYRGKRDLYENDKQDRLGKEEEGKEKGGGEEEDNDDEGKEEEKEDAAASTDARTGVMGWRASEVVALSDPLLLAASGSECLGEEQAGEGARKERKERVYVRQVSAAMQYVLVLLSNGTLLSGGDCHFHRHNEDGQGSRGRRKMDLSVMSVVSGFDSRIEVVATGDTHSLAISACGTVWAWGCNMAGQLGDGTIDCRASPVKVLGLGGVPRLEEGKRPVQIAAGGAHSVAVLEDGGVVTWGCDNFGQLGSGKPLAATAGLRLVPGHVVGLVGERVIKVAAGGFHTLALSEAGRVFAWGYNAHGQVGDGTPSSTSLPVCVLAGSAGSCCIDIAAGHAHSLALLAQACNLSTHKYHTSDHCRHVGVPSQGTRNPLRAPSPGDCAMMPIPTSCSEQCELRVMSWGLNHRGQLGDGTLESRSRPTLLSLPLPRLACCGHEPGGMGMAARGALGRAKVTAAFHSSALLYSLSVCSGAQNITSGAVSDASDPDSSAEEFHSDVSLFEGHVPPSWSYAPGPDAPAVVLVQVQGGLPDASQAATRRSCRRGWNRKAGNEENVRFPPPLKDGAGGGTLVRRRDGDASASNGGGSGHGGGREWGRIKGVAPAVLGVHALDERGWWVLRRALPLSDVCGGLCSVSDPATCPAIIVAHDCSLERLGHVPGEERGEDGVRGGASGGDRDVFALIAYGAPRATGEDSIPYSMRDGDRDALPMADSLGGCQRGEQGVSLVSHKP